jgi:hypothetical protein
MLRGISGGKRRAKVRNRTLLSAITATFARALVEVGLPGKAGARNRNSIGSVASQWR